MPTIVFTGGGTGGHVTPALALIEALQAKHAHVTCAYVGNGTSLEGTLVPQAGVPFSAIRFHGMPRKSLLTLLPWAFELLTAIWVARGHLQRLSPKLVVGTGGYVSAPVLLAAKSLGIPFLIHEPDAHPGLVNRLMSRWAVQITGAFEAARTFWPNRPFTATGNPLRGTSSHPPLTKPEAIQALGLDWDPAWPVLVITGGSQGAKSLNKAVRDALAQWLSKTPFGAESTPIAILHQTGAKDLAEHEAALLANPLLAALLPHGRYHHQAFFENMTPVWTIAHAVVARAGSLTLSELTQVGCPAVLVPYPHAAADHQTHNAQALVDAGAAVLLPDASLTGETLTQALTPLLTQAPVHQAMHQASKALGKPRATSDILAQILTILR